MSNDTATAYRDLALLDSEHIVVIKRQAEPGTVAVYRLDTRQTLVVEEHRVDWPTATPAIRLTEAQRIVCCYRFQDVATTDDDMGAVLKGSTLRITNPIAALETLDSAIDICDDAADGGDAKYRREAATTRRLRAKVLTAVTT